MNVNKKVTHRHGHFRSEFRIVYLLNLLGQFIQKVISWKCKQFHVRTIITLKFVLQSW